MSCIKSIQRGTGSGNATITISEIDIDKSVVLVTGGKGYYSDFVKSDESTTPYGYLKGSTTLIIANASTHYRDLSGNMLSIDVPYAWQVIEFV